MSGELPLQQRLRWVSVGYEQPRPNIPTATISRWGMTEYYVLQAFNPVSGKWEDIDTGSEDFCESSLRET